MPRAPPFEYLPMPRRSSPRHFQLSSFRDAVFPAEHIAHASQRNEREIGSNACVTLEPRELLEVESLDGLEWLVRADRERLDRRAACDTLPFSLSGHGVIHARRLAGAKWGLVRSRVLVRIPRWPGTWKACDRARGRSEEFSGELRQQVAGSVLASSREHKESFGVGAACAAPARRAQCQFHRHE